MKKNITNKQLVYRMLDGYKNYLSCSAYRELEDSLLAHESKNSEKSLEEFARDVQANFPQLEILHKSCSREKLEKINIHLAVIKVIIVISFILTILGAIAYVVSMDG